MTLPLRLDIKTIIILMSSLLVALDVFIQVLVKLCTFVKKKLSDKHSKLFITDYVDSKLPWTFVLIPFKIVHSHKK